ncbi:MAG: hypothetical protein H7831_02290 [Magnetococcus sp. WYHC-3]
MGVLRESALLAQAMPSLGLLLLLSLSGCSWRGSALLPSETRQVSSPWDSFEAGKEAFKRVRPYQTNMAQLQEIGFDPEGGRNVEVLNHLDIQKLFNFDPGSYNQLPGGVLDCLAAEEDCLGYRFKVEDVRNKRTGSLVLDWLNFRRTTVTAGWNFTVTLVVKRDTVLEDEMVVYKLWSGTPRVDETVVRSNPLGPIQDVGGSVMKEELERYLTDELDF